MSTTGNRIEGKAEQVGGALKKNIGKLLGNEQMEAEGTATELKGKAREEAAKGVERVKGKVQEVAGKVERGVGKLVGDHDTAAEGAAREVEGRAHQKVNE